MKILFSLSKMGVNKQQGMNFQCLFICVHCNTNSLHISQKEKKKSILQKPFLIIFSSQSLFGQEV